jgi:dihydrofolate reductase
MKIILYMAMSLNGIIAKEDGSEDFFTEGIWKVFVDLAEGIGCIIWGRKTYEAVLTWPKKYINSIKKYKVIVVSADQKYEVGKGFTKVVSPEEAIEILSSEGFNKAIVTGGATLNSSFVRRGLVDEVMITVDSVVVGEGIPLFKPEDFEMKLNLLKIKKFTDDIVVLHYKVV